MTRALAAAGLKEGDEGDAPGLLAGRDVVVHPSPSPPGTVERVFKYRLKSVVYRVLYDQTVSGCFVIKPLATNLCTV